MSLEEYKGVFVFAQQVDNVLDGVAFELLGKGKDLAKDLNTEVLMRMHSNTSGVCLLVYM